MISPAKYWHSQALSNFWLPCPHPRALTCFLSHNEKLHVHCSHPSPKMWPESPSLTEPLRPGLTPRPEGLPEEVLSSLLSWRMRAISINSQYKQKQRRVAPENCSLQCTSVHCYSLNTVNLISTLSTAWKNGVGGTGREESLIGWIRWSCQSGWPQRGKKEMLYRFTGRIIHKE